MLNMMLNLKNSSSSSTPAAVPEIPTKYNATYLVNYLKNKEGKSLSQDFAPPVAGGLSSQKAGDYLKIFFALVHRH